MKAAFRISIVFNAVLAGLLAVVFVNRSGPSPILPVTAADSAPMEALQNEVRAPEPANTASFQWRQIESPDYRTYISNLRSIGCPEQTIRDIIVADVDNLYAPRREPLDRKISALAEKPSLSSGRQRASLEAELQNLRNEQATLISQLLGPSAVPGQLPLPALQRTVRVNPQERVFRMPLVFQPVDLGDFKLNNRQLEMIDHLRQQFLTNIGGVNQDPNDAGYQERWRRSQPEIDEQLRGVLGINAYQNFQLQAAANARGESIQFPQPELPGMRQQ